MEAGIQTRTRIGRRSTDSMSHGVGTKYASIHGSVTGAADTNPRVVCSAKSNCKETMRDLNGRLAGFIEKVHQLELHNGLLDKEIQEIKGRTKPSVEEQYGPELRTLRELVLDISHQKHQMEIGLQNLEEELSGLRRRFVEEAQRRSDAERTIQTLQKDMGEAFQAKLQLDQRAQCLMDEMHSLKIHQEAQVSEMLDQIQSSAEEVSMHRLVRLDITDALQDIRAQLEDHTCQQVGGHSFPSQFTKLTEAAKTKGEVLRAIQQEIQGYRRQVQTLDVEVVSSKATGEALEKQLHDVEDRHMMEILQCQNAVQELENELTSCKFDLSGNLREYQDLLNVKMALDVEILSYRNLLCSEEARLSSMSDSSISLPYIYHQSPIYALPCHNRTGEAHRRLEPHYKFVEEIITETSREIVMSEFEESGSEETEEGQNEENQTKRDGGRQKE